jgi:hypothetical protein
MSISLQCRNCLLFNDENDRAFTCDAFPRGIPQEILDGKHDHLFAFPGDRGFRRIPIAWTGPGAFRVITPEREAQEIEGPVDLSARRDAEVGLLYQYYVDQGDRTGEVLEARPDSSDFNDWNYYPTYTGRKVVVTRELIRRINYAEIVLKSPDAVFRDFQEQPKTRQQFVVETWLGRVLDGGRLLYIKARIVNDTVHRLAIARKIEELPGVLSDVSGIKIYQKSGIQS